MGTNERDDVRLLKSLNEIWEDAKKILAQTVPKKITYQIWIKPIVLLDLSPSEATFGVNNEFARGMVAQSAALIKDALSQVTGQQLSIKVVVDARAQAENYAPTVGSIVDPKPAASRFANEQQGAAVQPHSPPAYFDPGSFAAPSGAFAQPATTVFAPAPYGNAAPASYAASPFAPAQAAATSQPMPNQGGLQRANLNAKYVFETFVVGAHNRFCHSAALAVAGRPGQAYNPLFLYGDAGLGKTHLMHCIGHEILKHSPHLVVRYMSCENFTNELINSIRDDRMMDFRKRYRKVDVLLVDDIQFIQGKESTQEEFFHTFNALRESGRQIVISSDRAPKALSRLEERLRSRFEWGLIADIQPPDLETRVAILRKKCELEGMRVQDSVLEYIASTFTTNVRELEGALTRAHAFAGLSGSTMTPAFVEGILQPLAPAQKKKQALSLERIMDAVASHYRVEPSEMRSAKRSQDLALPRHVAMYLAHEMMQMSFPRIGQSFGNRKHTSALYAHKQIKEKLDSDLVLANAIRQIQQQLNG